MLIVDGFDRTDGAWGQPDHFFAFTHGTAIISNQFSFDTVPNESVEDSLVSLTDYDAVFWMLGDEAADDETFSHQEQLLLKNFLESGGYLCVTGSQVAWDLDPDGNIYATPEDEMFLHEYLKSDYAGNIYNDHTVIGAPNSLLDGLSFNFGQTPYTLDSANVIAPTDSGATPCLIFNDTTIAGIQYQGIFGNGAGEGKLVFLTTPFETISDAQLRTEVMNRVLDFFFNITGIESGSNDAASIPARYELMPAYPNPFNPETTIEFRIPTSSEVSLEIYNPLGQKIRTLYRGKAPAGTYRLRWDGRDDSNNQVASGVYLIRFQAHETQSSYHYQTTRKIVLLK
ncbi:MAG: T9SS C-terminal target domain-containing protein [Calditrichaeota bacterium]|nr:MAG: T9SS C-terminal target domain-containing protein [Calditrichota bacterium]